LVSRCSKFVKSDGDLSLKKPPGDGLGGRGVLGKEDLGSIAVIEKIYWSKLPLV